MSSSFMKDSLYGLFRDYGKQAVLTRYIQGKHDYSVAKPSITTSDLSITIVIPPISIVAQILKTKPFTVDVEKFYALVQRDTVPTEFANVGNTIRFEYKEYNIKSLETVHDCYYFFVCSGGGI